MQKPEPTPTRPPTGEVSDAERAAASRRAADALPPATEANTEERLGDRGAASGRNLEQLRAIGQDDPNVGSRTGRRVYEGGGYPNGERTGTDATQLEQAQHPDSKRRPGEA